MFWIPLPFSYENKWGKLKVKLYQPLLSWSNSKPFLVQWKIKLIQKRGCAFRSDLFLDEVTIRFLSCRSLSSLWHQTQNKSTIHATVSCLLKLTNVKSSINYFFKAKGNSIPLRLRKLIFEAAGENKLNYVAGFFLLTKDFELLKLPREPHFLNGSSHTGEQSKLYQCCVILHSRNS